MISWRKTSSSARPKATSTSITTRSSPALQNADSIWILGPGEAKGELKSASRARSSAGDIAHVETVDKMTDHEIAEHVRQLLCAGSNN